MSSRPDLHVSSAEFDAKRPEVFDPMASVWLYRDDIVRFGRIRPGTERRAMEEELTYVIEGLDAPMRTDFTLAYENDQILAADGTPLMSMLARGQYAARVKATVDPRLTFHVQRTEQEYEEGLRVQRMMSGTEPGNTLITISKFPDQAYRQFGAKPLESLGYQPKRLLAFIRIWQKTSQGQVRLLSQSIDNSDSEIFDTLVPGGQTIGTHFQSADEIMNELVMRYDTSMQNKYGGTFRSGRPRNTEPDAWRFVNSQVDLIEYYMHQIKLLAQMNETDPQKKQNLTLSFWATLKARMNKGLVTSTVYEISYASQSIHLQQEMMIALQGAIERRETLIGCGGSMAALGETDLAKLSPETTLAAIFGEKNGAEVWRKGVCRVPNCPSPTPTEVGPCDVCRTCEEHDNKGHDLMTLYPKKPRATKSIIAFALRDKQQPNDLLALGV